MLNPDIPFNKKPFIADDDLPIPNVGKRLVIKEINKKQLMRCVRRDTRYGINLIDRVYNNPEEGRMSAVKHCLTKSQIAEHVRSQHVARELDELYAFYQTELLKAEYPEGLPKFDFDKYNNDFYLI